MKLSRIAISTFSIILLWGSVVLAQTSTHYQVHINGKVDLNMPSAKMKIGADTHIKYTLIREGQKETVVVNSLGLKTSRNGKPLVDSYLDSKLFRNVRGGVTTETKVEDAEDQLKKMLTDSFDVPLVVLTLDELGKELERKVVARPGAQTIIQNGGVANARLFHPKWGGKDDRWTSKRRMSMGNGAFASGTLTYEKGKEVKPGVVEVKVTGLLTNPMVNQGVLTLKDVRYVTTGTQTFDTKINRWTHGTMNFDVTYKMESNGQSAGDVKGKMIINLTTLTAAATPAPKKPVP